jgi:hypothetical protein
VYLYCRSVQSCSESPVHLKFTSRLSTVVLVPLYSTTLYIVLYPSKNVVHAFYGVPTTTGSSCTPVLEYKVLVHREVLEYQYCTGTLRRRILCSFAIVS